MEQSNDPWAAGYTTTAYAAPSQGNYPGLFADPKATVKPYNAAADPWSGAYVDTPTTKSVAASLEASSWDYKGQKEKRAVKNDPWSSGYQADKDNSYAASSNFNGAQ